jgi:short-subunit dehydrogenase
VETPFFAHETFRRRPRRPEAERTVPIEEVSRAIIAAIEKDRFFTVVPRTLGFAIWLRNVFPSAVDALLGRLLATRVREVRSMDTHTKSAP